MRSAVTLPMRGRLAIISAVAVLMLILVEMGVWRGVTVGLSGAAVAVAAIVALGRGVGRVSRETRVAGTLGVSMMIGSGIGLHALKAHIKPPKQTQRNAIFKPICPMKPIIDSLSLIQSIRKLTMKIVLIGANGQLGSDLREALCQHQVWASARVALTANYPNEQILQLDVTQLDAVRDCLNQIQPDLVLNASAFHRVDDIERDSSQALLLNGHVPHQLALMCRALDCAFLHVSTDYVYDGAKQAPYVESDLPNPLSSYGASKLVGEHLLRAAWHKHFIVRTCGLYGVAGASGKGGNFVNTMLRLAREGKPIKVVADQICTPTFTFDLARQIALLIESSHYGLYHITNDGGCSWFEFAGEIFKLAGLTPSLAPITSTQFNAPATRPPYSVLENAHLKAVGLDQMRHWREALADYVSRIVSRETSG